MLVAGLDLMSSSGHTWAYEAAPVEHDEVAGLGVREGSEALKALQAFMHLAGQALGCQVPAVDGLRAPDPEPDGWELLQVSTFSI